MLPSILLILASGAVPTLAQLPPPFFTPGRCKFDAIVTQSCSAAKIHTMIDVSPFYDGADKQFMQQTDDIDLTGGLTLSTTVLFRGFKVGFKDNSVEMTYDGHFWRGGKADPKFSCWTEKWTKGKDVCGKDGERSQKLHCYFDCVAPKPAINTKPTTEKRDLAFPSILAGEPSSITESANATTGKNFPYAPGMCSFKLQLFNQCLHNPDEDYSQILGMIYSIQDNNRATVVSYPEGAGRIDGRSVVLTGIGNMSIGYDTNDSQVYFSFGPAGGWWSTATQDDGHAKGLCAWGKWTREERVCDDSPEAYDDHPRLSDMTCIFHC